MENHLNIEVYLKQQVSANHLERQGSVSFMREEKRGDVYTLTHIDELAYTQGPHLHLAFPKEK